MDDSVHRVETKDRVVAVQPKLISCSKQNCNSSKGDGCCINLTEDRNCNLNPTMPSSKSVSPEEGLDKCTSVSQITSHLKDRLNLKSGVGVNGIINGLGIGVDLSHSLGSEHISNGKALTECSSHCDRCEDCLDNENVIHNPTTLLNCIENQLDNVSRSNEPACCTNVRSKCSSLDKEIEDEINYVSYKSELQMPDIMRLIQKDLSEPYSIYTYRYFIHNWPKLCFLAMDGNECVGAIVCKLDHHRKVVKRGYIAMLAVDEKYRKRKIGSNLVLKAIRAMVADKADEVVLETEITNRPALRLYENLGFVRDKRLFRYYLNGVDALRLKLWLR